jgi:Domain of Unknown Function (DUF928)
MFIPPKPNQTIGLGLLICGASLAALATLTPPVAAQTASPTGGTTDPKPDSTLSPTLKFIPPQEPDNGGDPGGRGRGGGSRNPCKPFQNFTALVPQTPDHKPISGFTAESHPTFWFYIPSKMPAGTVLEFNLLDPDENTIYSQTLTLPTTPAGIIHLSVPPTATALQEKQAYRWGLTVSCQPNPTSAKVFVKGLIYHTALTQPMEQEIRSAATPPDRAIFYAAHGLWYDALTTLARERSQSPQGTALTDPATVKSAWRELLQQGNLGDLVEVPIGSCCTIPPSLPPSIKRPEPKSDLNSDR